MAVTRSGRGSPARGPSAWVQRSSPGAAARSRGTSAVAGLALAALALLAAGAAGCAPVKVPLRPYYVPAEAPAATVDVRLDVPYRSDAARDPKHRLDLFLPRERSWPMLVFVHGGALERGDTGARILGHDIYRNIGRYYSSRGVGVALVNYRLQPGVAWPDQVDDVARATAWVLEHGPELGAEGRVLLAGHSAGSWLAARVALDDGVQAAHGFTKDAIAGVISVSGSGFDLRDERTWELFGRRDRWRRRFSTGEPGEDWETRASAVPLVDGTAPPFVLLFSSREWRALARQNRLLCDALETAAAQCSLVEIPGLGHRRMVLAMSHDGRPVAGHVLKAIRALSRMGSAVRERP